MKAILKYLLFALLLFAETTHAWIYGIVNQGENDKTVCVESPGSYNVRMITYDHSKMRFLYKNNAPVSIKESKLFTENSITVDGKKVNFTVPAKRVVFLETLHLNCMSNKNPSLLLDQQSVSLESPSKQTILQIMHNRKKALDISTVKNIGVADMIILTGEKMPQTEAEKLERTPSSTKFQIK